MADSTFSDRKPPSPIPLVTNSDQGRGDASLPNSPTTFVGRDREIADIVALLRRDDVRLVTLIGPGGIGKSRLALQVAEMMASDLADGVRFVDLSVLLDARLVMPAIAQSLGIPEVGAQTVKSALGDWLTCRELLLVLDNVEHVIESAVQLALLLRECPSLRILATSRVVLHLSAEYVFPVKPLAVPDEKRRVGVSDVMSSEAVALFVQRARSAQLDFALTDANASVVSAIVRQLEGLPLAIELAAARLRQLSLTALRDQISERLRVLTDGPRDAPVRHRALRDTIAWSYDLLSADEQRLFRRLSVFVGGCTPMAAEAVTEIAGASLLEGLFALVDQSLLQRIEANDGTDTSDLAGSEPRFGMLETVREFASEQLEASDEADRIRSRHLIHMADFAENTVGFLQPNSIDALSHIAAEFDNIRAALGYALTRGEVEQGLRLAVACFHFWEIRGYLTEGRHWFEELLALDGHAPASLRAGALFGLGWLAGLQGDLDVAQIALHEVIQATETDGSPRTHVAAVIGLGVIAHEQADVDGAEEWLREGLRLAEGYGDPWFAAIAFGRLGLVAADRGDLAEGARLIAASLEGNLRAIDPWSAALCLGALSDIARRQGDRGRSASLNRERLAIYRELRDREHLADCFVAAAEATIWLGHPDQAARLLGAGIAVFDEIGLHISAHSQEIINEATEAARHLLGDDAFEAAWFEGKGRSPQESVIEADQVFAEAEKTITLAPAPVLDPAFDKGAHGLSTRELEVVRLIADGKSNREIADTLFISHRTASTHVRNILAKLGLESRTAVAAWAFRHGLA